MSANRRIATNAHSQLTKVLPLASIHTPHLSFRKSYRAKYASISSCVCDSLHMTWREWMVLGSRTLTAIRFVAWVALRWC